jgi:hypothetical protein
VDADDPVCLKCVGDIELRRLLSDSATRAVCANCGRRRQAVSVRDVALRVGKIFLEFYEAGGDVAEAVCVAEVRPDVGSFPVVGQFQAMRGLRRLDLTLVGQRWFPVRTTIGLRNVALFNRASVVAGTQRRPPRRASDPDPPIPTIGWEEGQAVDRLPSPSLRFVRNPARTIRITGINVSYVQE